MYIKLTNASPQHRGNNIAINSEQVVTVHSSVVTREDGLVETVTFVFCPPHGTWEVSESYDSVVAQLNQAVRGEIPEPEQPKKTARVKLKAE